MRVPLSWLREFVTWTGSVGALAERLTMGGLKVEAIEEVGALDPEVRVGRLVTIELIPGSDHLQVCRVDVGGSVPIEVVSGAPGLAPGLVVPVALPGAHLPGGVAVRAVPMRGVNSAGVLCSEAELGLGDDASTVLVLPADTP